MKRIEAYTKKDNFLPQILMQKSVVAGALCSWVKAVEEYHKALKIVRPKIAKKEAAEALLKDLMAQLQAMQDEFALLTAKLKELQDALKKNTDEMEAYKADLE
jgi:dynein heavy chain